jgi:hypothetical protein
MILIITIRIINKPKKREATMKKTKTCTRCGETRVLVDFFKNSKCEDGIAKMCKMCHVKGQNKRWYNKTVHIDDALNKVSGEGTSREKYIAYVKQMEWGRNQNKKKLFIPRKTELKMQEEYIKKHGVTKCPPSGLGLL